LINKEAKDLRNKLYALMEQQSQQRRLRQQNLLKFFEMPIRKPVIKTPPEPVN
jgi:hypothetical protein